MDYEAIEREAYENIWGSLQGKFSKQGASYFNSQPSLSVLDFLSFLEQRGAGGTMLDMGCGNARNTIAFAEKGYRAYGIDVSREALSMAEKNIGLRDVAIDLKQGSVFSLPYQDQHFTVVLDFGCLHHLRKCQWGLYLKNLLRVIRDGGYYYLHCFSVDTPYIPGERRPKSRERNWSVDRSRHYCHYFTDNEVQGLFGRHFEILKQYEWAVEDFPEIMKVFYMQRR